MQAGERKSGKNQVQMDSLCLLHHKTSWVLKGDIGFCFVNRYLLSPHQNEVIKIEELEDKPEEPSILTVDKNIALIKKGNPMCKEPKLKNGFTCEECGKFFAAESETITC